MAKHGSSLKQFFIGSIIEHNQKSLDKVNYSENSDGSFTLSMYDGKAYVDITLTKNSIEIGNVVVENGVSEQVIREEVTKMFGTTPDAYDVFVRRV